MINGPTDQRTPPMTPQLALRVAIVGGLALVVFALIFFRLWFLQVLDTSHYDALAQTNVVRDIPIAAPRGNIEDSSGNIIAGSTPVPAVLISPESLPVRVSLDIAHPGALAKQPAKDYALYDKLAGLLGISTRPKNCKYEVYLSGGVIDVFRPKLAPIPCLVAQGVASSQYVNVTIKSDVSVDIQDYIAERQTQFPGVLSTQVFQRTYPLGNVAGQVFGSLGQLEPDEVGKKQFPGVPQGSIVGQNGLENEYNQYLQGTAGEERVKVNSENQFEGYANETRPTQGDTLKTSLDTKLAQVGQSALAQSMKLNGGTGGSFVAMDPQNGSVYAMGSLPSYNPSIFTHPISDKTYAQDFGPDSNAPLDNRAIAGAIPDGSTFKVITATAALETGDWSLDETYDDDAPFCFTAGGLCLHNSGNAHYGVIDLQTAIEVSDDEFFYNLGLALNNKPIATQDHPNGGALQEWARKFGISKTTGVDLPGEASGEIGTPALLELRYKEEIECQDATGPYAYTDNATGQISATKLPGYTRSKKIAACGIANVPYWTEGDNVETGVGQFDDEVTPMQLAVVYAAIANGGTIVTPHIGQSIESPSGTILQSIDPAPKSKLDIKPAYLSAIREGLRLAVTGGTSADVMGSFPEQVYGKTGTAQLGPSKDSPEDAWYACYVPASATSKPIVVVVNVDKGGFGDVAATPVAREILSQWFFGNPGSYTPGTSTDT